MKKILCLIAGALLVVAIIGLAGCGGSSQTTGGSGSSNSTVSEADLGVPVYPGATKVDMTSAGGPAGTDSSRPQPSGANGSMPGPGNGTPPTGGATPPGGSSAPGPTGSAPGMNGQNPGNMNATMLWTKDSVEKVSAWYKKQLSSKTDFKEQTAPTGAGGNQGGGVVDALGVNPLDFAHGLQPRPLLLGQAPGVDLDLLHRLLQRPAPCKMLKELGVTDRLPRLLPHAARIAPDPPRLIDQTRGHHPLHAQIDPAIKVLPRPAQTDQHPPPIAPPRPGAFPFAL